MAVLPLEFMNLIILQRMSKINFLTLFLFFSTLLVFSAKGQHLNIYPTIIDFRLNDPGSIETQTINITNNSDKSQSVEAYFGDWNRNEDGSHSYFESGSQEFSCAGWAKLNVNFIEIKPHESAQLIVTL